jgi:DNA invertase Pin-like site-specific DNA recombinase
MFFVASRRVDLGYAGAQGRHRAPPALGRAERSVYDSHDTGMSSACEKAGLGRAGSIDAAQVGAMKARGIGASEIANALKIGRASIYRVLEAG